LPITSPGLPGEPPANHLGPCRSPAVRQTVDVPSTAAGMSAIHRALDRFWLAVAATPPANGASWDAEFTTAVGEIAANIIRHGHLHAVGVVAPKICLRLTCRGDRVEGHFVDEGAPYNPPIASSAGTNLSEGDQSIDIDALAEGGRGLALARAALDLLAYRRTVGGQNHWWLVKRRPVNGPGVTPDPGD